MTTFNVSTSGRAVMDKDPVAVLDYSWDWGSWLMPGDTIASYEVSVESPLVRDSHSRNAAVVTAFISGGGSKLGEEYRASCRVTTASGRTEVRSIYLRMAQR